MSESRLAFVFKKEEDLIAICSEHFDYPIRVAKEGLKKYEASIFDLSTGQQPELIILLTKFKHVRGRGIHAWDGQGHAWLLPENASNFIWIRDPEYDKNNEEEEGSISVYIFEVRDIDGKIRYIAIAEKNIAKDDLTESETLTVKGRIKFGLTPTDRAEIIGLQTLNLDNKVSSNIVKDSCGKKWRYIPSSFRWDEVKQQTKRRR